MADEYRVPKHTVSAEVVLTGTPPRRVRLFLGERAQHRTGRERPSDLLNRGQRFVPVEDPDSGFVLLRCSAVLYLTVDAEAELSAGPGEDPGDEMTLEGAERTEVRVVVEDGTELEGTVSFIMPPGEQRLQDFLNQADRFIRIRDGEKVRIVNTRRIAWVEAP